MLNRRLFAGVGVAALPLLIGIATPTAKGHVPLPESVIGFAPCADFKLATSEQIADYLRALDASSDRIQLVDLGPTTEGRRQLLAVISSEDNLRMLPRYMSIARSLALNSDASGRPLSDDRARQLSRQGKAIVWVDFGLHSTEVAHAQTAPWLAWKIVAGDSTKIRDIREKVILLLAPDLNPDGTTMVSNWYASHAGKPWELTLPGLYHRYAGHDNNRDWFMFTQAESRNIAKALYEQYLPQIVYDHHQTAPFPARIFVPPFAEPANVHIPPLVMSGINTISEAITRRLEDEGKIGVISRVEFDTWWNGGMRTAPYFHNMVGILTETGHASPTPAAYEPSTFPSYFANGTPTLEPSADYPRPYRGGRWTLRRSCEYMMSASMAVLSVGAKLRERWQYDIYRMARDAMHAGARETYVIPATQWDPAAAVRMVNALRTGGVEIERATSPFKAGAKSYAAGAFIIRGAQPFLPYIRDLLNPQQYPDRRTPPDEVREAPYDISGWTLNLQMGVTVDKLAQAMTVPTEKVDVASLPAGHISGDGQTFFAIDPRTNDAFLAVNRLLRTGAAVFRTAAPTGEGGTLLPAGTFLVKQDPVAKEQVAGQAAALGLNVFAIDIEPAVPLVRLISPRVGLYSAWGGNTDEGWTRWLLEQYGFPYLTLRDSAIRAGDLRASYDVILLPDATYRDMLAGVANGALPDAYTGGMTDQGVRNLYQFVMDGGTLVAQDSASELPLRAFDMPVDDAVSGRPRKEFLVPGTLLRLALDTRHPVAWGLPGEVAAFFADSPAFQVRETKSPRPRVVAAYPETELVLSGWARGETYLRNRAAVIEGALGKGHVVLLGFRTQHRAQSHATFKLLFNAIYLPAIPLNPGE